MKDHECHTCSECFYLESIRMRVTCEDDTGRWLSYWEDPKLFCTRQRDEWEGIKRREPTDEACQFLDMKEVVK